MFIVNATNVNLMAQTLILFMIAFPHENTVNTVTKYHTLKQEYLSRYTTPLRIRFERFLHLLKNSEIECCTNKLPVKECTMPPKTFYLMMESTLNGRDKRRFVHPSHTIL